MTGRRLYFDIESDGLLIAKPSAGIKQNTKVHCIGAIDLDTGEELYWGPPVPHGHVKWSPALGSPAGTVEDGVKVLGEARLIIGHNAIGYDAPALEMLYPGWKRPKASLDSMVVAKVIWPYDVLLGPDLAIAKRLQMDGRTMASFLKRHSLKAWGIRIGEHKDEYTGGFEEWNPDMASYMLQDCRTGVALWRLCEKRLGWVPNSYGDEGLPNADLVWPYSVIETECKVAQHLQEQEEDGIHFDMDEAVKLRATLSNLKAKLEADLKTTFGAWWQPGAVVTPKADRSVLMPEFPNITRKRFGKTGKELAPYVGPPKCHYSTDAPYTPIEWTEYNPSSRDHLGLRLQAVFGWKPKKFGNTDRTRDKPVVDESVLEEIPEAVMPKEVRKLILDYFVVTKTLAMVAVGAKAWIHLATLPGEPRGTIHRIHGRVDPSGAVTGRGTHSDPNLSQVPSVTKAKVKDDKGNVVEVTLYGLDGRYGYECRALFTADPGWEQTGVDASSLELIDLGHYLQPYDNGKFSERVCDPSRDPHKEHGDLTGLTRANAKTATYLYIYGGSAYKLSLDLTLDEDDDIPSLLSYRGLTMLLRGLERRFDAEFVSKMDDNQKAKLVKARKIIIAFEAGIEGIKDLKEHVSAIAEKRGWLKGMDGRKVHVRKAHAALNTLLQSAGAQTCKLWMVLVHKKLNERGLYRGTDYKQVLWVHDELQFTHRPGLGPIIKEVAEEAMKEAGLMLGLRGTYRTDGKTGLNWATCH